MIVPKKPPMPIKTPVKITDTTYALYYAKPVNLGNIHNKNGIWVTEDGVKFISSREALDYLATLHDVGYEKASTAPQEVKDMAYQDIIKLRMNKKKTTRNRKKGNMVRLPDGMSLDDLKQLLDLAEKLKDNSPPVKHKLMNAKKLEEEKQNDSIANIRK